MTYEDLMLNVRNKLLSRAAITAVWIQQRYHVLQGEARQCLAELQRDGLVAREWNTNLGGYQVLIGETEKQ